MIFTFINFLRGYLIIEATGFFIERFINLAIKNNIFLWEIKKSAKNKATMKISIKGFKKIRNAARKTGTTVRIKEKKGLPLFLYRHRRRKAFYAGILLFALILAALTSFIWSIEITGNEKIDKNLIREELRACGIDIGVVKYNHSSQQIKQEMLLRVPELSWIWVDIRGTRAFVEVKERTQKPEIIPADEPCNIVAGIDGVITEMIITGGTPVAAVGDIVKKGDLLVSGVNDSAYEGVILTHSTGEIYATTWRELSEIFPMTRSVFTPSGEARTRYSVTLGSLNVPLFSFGKIDFKSYDTKESHTQLKLWGDIYLPVVWKADTLEELIESEVRMSAEQAAEYYGEVLHSKIIQDSLQDTEVKGRSIAYEIIGENIQVTCTLEFREEIGQKIQIYREESLD